MSIGFGGRFDPNMSDKINQLLAGKKSRADQINEFLEKDLGIDPKSLPLTASDALAALTTYFTTHSLATVEFVGNSVFGLVTINTDSGDHGDDEDLITCPSCGYAGGIWDSLPARTWECGDCGVISTIPATTDQVTAITEPHNGTTAETDQWHEFTRWYAALGKVHGRRFQMVKDDADWQHRFKVVPVMEEAPNTDPGSYEAGATLLITRNDEQEVVRVGTLFSDDGFTILRTMKSMTDTEGWTVREVL